MAKVQVLKRDARSKTLAERLEKIWDAYTAFDAETHNGLLAEITQRC